MDGVVWTTYDKLESRKYSLVVQHSKVGNGRSSTVYRCKNGSKYYACKQLNKGNHHSSLEQEALVLKKLKHPNIVEVAELGNCKDVFWLVVSPFCTASLEEFLRISRPNGETLGRYLTQMTHALFFSHTLGICHGDISSNNIMFHNGVPYWIDFGAAKVIMKGTSTVTAQPRFGTPGYGCPEPRKFGRKSDIFCLGILFIVCVRFSVLWDAFPDWVEDSFGGFSVEDFASDTIEELQEDGEADEKRSKIIELGLSMAQYKYSDRLDSDLVMEKLLGIFGALDSSVYQTELKLPNEEQHEGLLSKCKENLLINEMMTTEANSDQLREYLTFLEEHCRHIQKSITSENDPV